MQLTYVADVNGSQYHAGACNIGPAEIRARRVFGAASFVAAAALALALFAIDAPSALRWIVALPMIGGFVGIIQAQTRFCANYGLRGLASFGELGHAERIADAEARAADRRKALRIFGTSIVLGILATLPIVLLP
jgi:hypothetical protein